jgi:hypothetical protein
MKAIPVIAEVETCDDGTLVLSVGRRINEMTLEKLNNFERVIGIKQPILVENTATAA